MLGVRGVGGWGGGIYTKFKLNIESLVFSAFIKKKVFKALKPIFHQPGNFKFQIFPVMQRFFR